MSKKRQRPVSLELLLRKFGEEAEPSDRKRRPRTELLAKMLWSRALRGDKEAWKMLLERLPPSLPEPDPPRLAPDSKDPYGQAINELKELYAVGLLPIDVSFMRDLKPDDPEHQRHLRSVLILQKLVECGLPVEVAFKGFYNNAEALKILQ